MPLSTILIVNNTVRYLATIRRFIKGNEKRIREIRPRAFMSLGLARLAIHKSLPRSKAAIRVYEENGF